MSNTDSRVSVLETKTSEHERRLRIQEEKNEQLNKISTYLELQYKHNTTQDKKIDKMAKQFEQVTSVLDGINTNLLNLNHDVKHVKDKQVYMDSRVESLEEERLAELKMFKKERRNSVIKIVTGVSIAVITALILFWLGLK